MTTEGAAPSELSDDEKSKLKDRLEEFERTAGDVERFAILLAEAHGQQLMTIAFVAVTATLIGKAPPEIQSSLMSTILHHLEDVRAVRAKVAAEEAAKAKEAK